MCSGCAISAKRDLNRRKNAQRRGARVSVRYRAIDIFERDRWRCHICGGKVKRLLPGTDLRGPTIDHLIPVSAGGADVASNVRLAHRDCNIVRGTGGVVQLMLVG